MFTAHLRDLKQCSPSVLSLLKVLVFWDPEQIEVGIIKVGVSAMRSSLGPSKSPAEREAMGSWVQQIVRRLMGSTSSDFNFSQRADVPVDSSTEVNSITLPSDNAGLLIELASSEVQLHGALQELQMLSLIKWSSRERGAYRMHDLTQTLVQASLQSEGTYLHWFRCAARIAWAAFAQIVDPTCFGSWHQCESLVVHMLSLRKYGELVDSKNEDILRADARTAAYWCSRGRYHEACKTYEKVLNYGGEVLHGAGIDIDQCRLGLADVKWHLGKLDESMRLYGEVRREQELQFGTSHPIVLNTLENLALVHRSQAQYGEARSMLQFVLETRQGSLGPNHVDTIRAIDKLAMTINTYAEAENPKAFTDAESLHLQALAYRENQLGKGHLDTLWTADNLATNYRAQGRYLEALGLYKRVLEGRRLQLGEDHPHTLWTLANIASVYTSLGRWEEAEVLWKQNLEYNEQRRGRIHSETLFAVKGLADLYRQQSRFEEAIDQYDRALSGSEVSRGEGHPSTLRTMHKLANLLRDQDMLERSAELFETLIARRKIRPGSGHADMLQTYNDAAALYVRMGKWTEAERFYREEIAESIKILGGLHPETERRELDFLRFLAC